LIGIFIFQGFEKEKKDAADEKLKNERTEADKSMQELVNFYNLVNT
jgi:hypothetical protein